MKVKNIGGQAVIEGVMMKSRKGWTVAVRDRKGEIHVRTEPLKEPSKLLGLPLVRGVAALYYALSLGIKALGFSAEKANEGEPDKKGGEGVPSKAAISLTIAASFLLGIGLFVLLPLYATKLIGMAFRPVAESTFVFNLIDGLIRVGVFLVYIVSVGLWGEMRRVFQYHGAEHKAIHAYEGGRALEVASVRQMSPLHPRCGTSFLLIVMIISILVFSFIPRSWAFVYKFAARVVLLPLIAGISYESLKASARMKGALRVFAMPGLMLQRLTTREPDDAQIEVAIRALTEVVSMEGGNHER